MDLYGLDTPALIVDLDRVERNIARMAEIARRGGKALRPHTKTHKTPEIAALQLNAGASGLTVAKLGEAEVYADSGFDDIFVANQIVGAQKIERLLDLSKQCRVIVGIDSIEAAAPLSKAAIERGMRIPIRIEVDTGLGRAGVRAVDQVVELGQRVAEMPGLELEGVFTHEGQIYHVSNSERPDACRAVAEKMAEICDSLAAVGVSVNTVSVGSTPGAAHLAEERNVTELRPGVYVLGDVMQTRLGFDPADCALSVLTTVVSRPDSDTAIVDAGTKSFSGDRAPEGSKHGLVTDDPAIIFDWANEEHGHLKLSESTLKPGIDQKLRILPWHACATVNMHDEMVAVRGEKVEAVWKVAARGRIR